MEDLAGRTRPVDLEAFRNLVDPREEDFLRANLLPREFRAIQRERMRAAVDYIRNTPTTRPSCCAWARPQAAAPIPASRKPGGELIDSALRLRAYALLSSALLYVRLVLPESRLSYGTLADNYQHLSALASQLALMQHPTQAARSRPCSKMSRESCSENPNSTGS